MPLLPPSGIGDFRVVQTEYTLTAIGSTRIASGSSNRVRLIVSAASGGVFFGVGSASLNNGLNLTSQSPIWSFSWPVDGALVNQEFWAAGSAQQVTVIEVFYQPLPTELQRRAHGNTVKADVSDASPHRKG